MVKYKLKVNDVNNLRTEGVYQITRPTGVMFRLPLIMEKILNLAFLLKIKPIPMNSYTILIKLYCVSKEASTHYPQAL
jgi:hypothetical protein